MNDFKEFCRARIVADGSYGMFPRYHIRYDIHPDFLRELFEDEEKLEEFAEQIKRDVLYKLGKCAYLEIYRKNDEEIVKRVFENMERKKRERSEEDVRHKENCQDV